MNLKQKHFVAQNAFRQTVSPQQEPPLNGLQVLLVEDEPDIAELLIIMLKDVGAEITLVTSAEEALATLEHQHPDILISNIRLPMHNGDWLIREIRSHEPASTPPLPAIAITSYTRDVHAENLLEAGYHWYLPKPHDPDELVAIVWNLTRGNP
jgi:CheY-like chemotaxis protein